MADADNYCSATVKQDWEEEPEPAKTSAKHRGHLRKTGSQTQHISPIGWKQSKEQQRRRLRRLFIADKNASRRLTNRAAPKRRRSPFFWYSLTLLLAVVIIAWYRNVDVLANFMLRYSSQYQAIVHNQLNYCDRATPLSGMFDHLRASVLNQDAALNQLEQTLTNQSSFQSVALLGSSGLGKSLTASILLLYFPWSENVRTYSWTNEPHIDELERYVAVQRLLDTLAHCGRNMLIIDNLAACDREFVSAINELALARNDVSNGTYNPDLKQLTIVYIFNLNRLLPDSVYEQQLEALQQLPQTTAINYKAFGRSELERCVRHEALLERMQLDERAVADILDNSDVKLAGCKTVRSKVLIYGKPYIDDQHPQLKMEVEEKDMTE